MATKARGGRAPSALSSGAFRFAVLLAVIFACGSTLLLWAVHRQVDDYAAEATNAMLRSEADALGSAYRGQGLEPVRLAIRNDSAAAGTPFHYLLTEDGRRIAGDLPLSAAQPGWRTGAEREAGNAEAIMRHLGVNLDRRHMLVIATDAFDIAATRDRLVRFALACAIAITIFALGGGLLAGRLFLSRLDRINRAVSRIIEGSADEQLPTIGVGPEFDALTDNLNRMLERNRAAMEGLRQVSTAIAHDLRTPLGRLKQHLELMRETGQGAAAETDDAVAQIDGILAIFQALLRIGMIEGGAGRVRFAPVNLGEIADRVVAAYEPVAEDAGQRLLSSHAQFPRVDGDAELLTQLLSNLIENAIVHTPAGTTIRSTLVASPRAVTLEVSDDGPGVAAGDVERIFDRFYRGTGSREGSGAGLGLALVAAIAHLHEATCRVDGARRGFCISVDFPAGRHPRKG